MDSLRTLASLLTGIYFLTWCHSVLTPLFDPFVRVLTPLSAHYLDRLASFSDDEPDSGRSRVDRRPVETYPEPEDAANRSVGRNSVNSDIGLIGRKHVERNKTYGNAARRFKP